MNIAEYFKTTKTYKNINTKKEYPIEINGLNPAAKALIIASNDNKSFVFCAEAAEASKLTESLKSLGKKAFYLTARDYILRDINGFSKEYEQKRINVLNKIITEEYDAVILDAEALTQKFPNKEYLIQNTINIKSEEETDYTNLIKRLSDLGYSRSLEVEGVGQFSCRGDILDIYAVGEEYPVRIEFFGDFIEKISYFSIETQRRKESIKKLTVLPNTEQQIPNTEELKKFADGIKTKNQKFFDTIENDIEENKFNTDRYMAFYNFKPVTVFDYIGKNNTVFIDELNNIKGRLKALNDIRAEDKTMLTTDGFLSKKTDCFYISKTEVFKYLQPFNIIYLDAFLANKTEIPPKNLISLNFKTLNCWTGSLDALIADIKEYNAKTAIILMSSEKSALLLKESLLSNGISAEYKTVLEKQNGKVVITLGSLPQGIYIKEDDILIISQGNYMRKPQKKKFKKGKAINNIEELKVGDYVVHYSHGIGKFLGVHQLKNNGIIKDYIKIQYRGSDVLYVPVTQLDLVSKYIGNADESRITLNKLGGTEWQKAKTKVKAAVKDMAKQLAKLYAKRMNEKGYGFLPDTTMQNDFEDRFEYEETFDQLRAAAEIKKDMERKIPMDRLLCGDVGFGKTEVALRAAFKCVDNGRQCAILVPTTLLANQHYATCLKRFYGFPVNIEVLSRFKTKKQLEQSLKNIKRGTADIVIGTHRMISKDVVFKDLGLLIIDEEQRFGVAQKERLKELFPTVDILTLSATPIPRTLNMAMSGLRDMSSIEEAPIDRRPVQTFVLEQNNGILAEAIRKELRRGGQVFYIHNRIDSIFQVASRLSEMLPDVRIGVAHGRMSEEELSGIWQSLLEQKIDVLVCTTIIETGVDVANANTLIVEDADRYGLAQLHQIRGRVGRSPRRAYAYFCFRKNKELSEIASKRLDAIREFTEFGSGYKIAMRDLEIRGAGNILGSEQHGHMEAVGYDMYIKLLKQAVDEETGESKTKEKLECTADLNINACIPESYIPFITARLGIYKKIADIRSTEDVNDVKEELEDRFGPIPKDVLGLIDVALIRGVAAKNGIYEIVQTKNVIKMSIKNLDMQKATEICQKIGKNASLSLGGNPCYLIKVEKNEMPLEVLKRISEVL